MDYYLKQASLIKKIAKKSNPLLSAVATTPGSTQSNVLTFGNNNDTDYVEQAKERLRSFITDPDKLDQITTALYADNDKYLKELVINWPDYESKLLSLKGSVVSVKRVTDVLEDKLQEALGKKQIKKDKQIVAERQEEVRERNEMGDEDVSAKTIRAIENIERENETDERNAMDQNDPLLNRGRDDISVIPQLSNNLVTIIKKASKWSLLTYKNLLTFLEKYDLIKPEEAFILQKSARKPKEVDMKLNLQKQKLREISDMLDNFHKGQNIVLYMVYTNQSDPGYKFAEDFIKDLAPKDYNIVLNNVADFKGSIERLKKLKEFNSKEFSRYQKRPPSPRKLVPERDNYPVIYGTPRYRRAESSSSPNAGIVESSSSPNAVEGKGLKPNQKVVNHKYYVNEDLLKNNGILEIRYVKNHHLAHVKPPMLSEKCKGCVLTMLNGGKINPDHFVSLNQFEKDMLRKIDKLFNTNQSLNDDDEENFTKNFELLKGSYLAGNDNQHVKNQLRQYIYHAFEIGKISRWVRDKMLFELKLV